MRSTSGNPAQNVIGSGITEEQVAEAVRRSGYPLQTVISQSLSIDFSVSEEWTYIDSDSLEVRALDIRADRYLCDIGSQSRVRPVLSLLIECKQSDLPYVLFLSASRAWMANFPPIAGLHGESITATTDDDAASWEFSIPHALGISRDPFVSAGPRHCSSMSKCVRKGKGVELTGSDAFNGVVLPLVKAVKHLKNQERPISTIFYHDMHIILAVAILDAPMIAVEVTGEGEELIYTPWLRLIRNEPMASPDATSHGQNHVIDVVHKDYFQTYISDHVMPFAERFASRAMSHAVELASGEAFIPNLRNRADESFHDMRPRGEYHRLYDDTIKVDPGDTAMRPIGVINLASGRAE